MHSILALLLGIIATADSDFPSAKIYSNYNINRLDTPNIITALDLLYSDSISSTDINLILSKYQSDNPYIVVASRNGASSVLQLAAVGKLSTLLQLHGNTTNAIIYSSSCDDHCFYTYHVENKSIGFSSQSSINLNPYDTTLQNYVLSWSLTDAGGGRSGDSSSSLTNCRKLIYVYSCLEYDDHKCSKCINGYLPNAAGECVQCHASCATCNGVGSDKCLTCKAPYTLNVSFSPYKCILSTCYSNTCSKCFSYDISSCVECISNYALSSATYGTCNQCQVPCKTCNPPWSSNLCTTCLNGYYLSGSYSCSQCAENCLACTGPLPTQCLTCRIGYSNTTIVGQYNCTKTQCQSSSCGLCFGSTNSCLSCNSGFALNGSTPSVCLPCAFPCKTCAALNINSCITCEDTYFISNNQCVQCHSSCVYCAGPGAYNCTECKNDFMIDYKFLHYCVKYNCPTNCIACVGAAPTECIQCVNGYYLTAKPSLCNICSSPCSTCNNSTNQCNTCINGYYLSGTTCNICHISCQSCSDAGALYCDSCAVGYSKIGAYCLKVSTQLKCKYDVGDSGACQICQNGYFLSLGVCVACIATCNKCTAIDNCQSCSPSYFQLNGQCYQCHQSCELCISSTKYDCVSCISGFTRDQTTGLCTRTTDCSLNCLNCVGNSDSDCIECKTGFIMNGLHKCVSNSCPINCESCTGSTCNEILVGFFLDTKNQTVTSNVCGTNCEECLIQNEDSKCTKCMENYELYNNLAISYCVKAAGCSTNCRICINDSINGCIQCKQNYNFVAIYDKVCATNQSCAKSCLLCTSSDNSKCVSCKDGFTLYEGVSSYCIRNSSCITNCDICMGDSAGDCVQCTLPYTPFNGLCITSQFCGINCQSCVVRNNNSQCASCNTDFFLYKNLSVSYCVNSVCVLNCQYCTAYSIEACIQCNEGYYLDALGCLPSLCFQNCKKCLNTNAYGCIECNSTDMVFLGNQPSICGYSTNCTPGCNFCLNSSINGCIVCSEEYMLSEGMVPSSCVKVGGCNGLCIECLSDKTCMKCPSGSELADGECRKKCITGYKYKAEAPYCEGI